MMTWVKVSFLILREPDIEIGRVVPLQWPKQICLESSKCVTKTFSTPFKTGVTQWHILIAMARPMESWSLSKWTALLILSCQWRHRKHLTNILGFPLVLTISIVDIVGLWGILPVELLCSSYSIVVGWIAGSPCCYDTRLLLGVNINLQYLIEWFSLSSSTIPLNNPQYGLREVDSIISTVFLSLSRTQHLIPRRAHVETSSQPFCYTLQAFPNESRQYNISPANERVPASPKIHHGMSHAVRQQRACWKDEKENDILLNPMWTILVRLRTIPLWKDPTRMLSTDWEWGAYFLRMMDMIR